MNTLPRLPLARTPTPIHRLKKTSESLGKDIYIWRDDLTGFGESGNKVRKLEYLLGDALAQGCDWIITCGGPQSNHTRATSIVARQLGLEVSIINLPKPGFDPAQTPTANFMLNGIFASHMVWADFEEFQKNGGTYDPYLLAEAERVRSFGKKPYIIPLGGSNALGCMGYINGVAEMLHTWKQIAETPAPESIFCALGSAGTFVGLELGILNQNLKQTGLFGINVLGPREVAEGYLSRLREKAYPFYSEKLNTHPLPEANIATTHLMDGYAGQGYAIASDQDLEFYIRLAREEGILLDPCYTGKAFQGMIAEIKKEPSRFKGPVLFLHSGGGFGNFAYAEQYKNVLLKR